MASACLAACHRDADSGATANGNAPGSPGASNAATVRVPQQGDTSSGRGPSGVAGSLPHPGSSGGDAVVGTTGKGTSANNAESQTAQPGSGLHGGLGASDRTSSMGAAGPSEAATPSQGSANRTTGSSVGNR
ncbi:hypothetical protein ACPWT1_10895 [Ramlibacter sp. MMS24-I3-19]|uniref:hypothetical protein n=1 Tax=Ramlibacter sp. MMS24-I3-19 TaxID=3416606 RepID=UPI003D0939F2